MQTLYEFIDFIIIIIVDNELSAIENTDENCHYKSWLYYFVEGKTCH